MATRLSERRAWKEWQEKGFALLAGTQPTQYAVQGTLTSIISIVISERM